MALNSATAYWNAADYDSGADTIPNRNGAAHTLSVGSTAGADTNDPTYLDHAGTNYVWFPAGTDNRLSVGGAPSGMGDTPNTVEVIMRLRMPDYTPAANASPIGSSGSDRRIQVVTNGKWRMYLNDGTNQWAEFTAPGFTDDTDVWVRFVADLTTDDADMYTSTTNTNDDGAVSWSAPENQSFDHAFGTLESLTDFFVGGSNGTAQDFAGRIYRLIIKYDGSTVLNMAEGDIDVTSQGTIVTTTGSNLTVDRTATGLTAVIVDRPMFVFDGTDDYLEAEDSGNVLHVGAAEELTTAVTYRMHNVDTVDRLLIGNNPTSARWRLFINTSEHRQANVNDGTDNAAHEQSFVTQGDSDLEHIAMRLDRGVDELQLFADGVAIGSQVSASAVDGIAPAGEVRIGLQNDGSWPADMEWYNTAVWIDSLTATQITAVYDTLILPPSAKGFSNLNVAGAGELLLTG